MKTQPAYTQAVISLLEKFSATQDDMLDRVAHKCAETLTNKGLIHLFGSGHSVIPTLEASPATAASSGSTPSTTRG